MTLTENTTNSQNLNYLNHHLMKSNQIHSVEKVTAKELYLILLQYETTTQTSQNYFESTFKELTLQWKHIYTVPRIITISSKSKFCKNNASLYSFCNLPGETVIHLFGYCSKTKRLLVTVIENFKRNLHILLLLPQRAIFGFLDTDDKIFLILTRLLSLFKYCIYVSISSKFLPFEAVLKSNMKVYKSWKNL